MSVLRVDRRSVQNFDWMLFGLIIILAMGGIINLVSATAAGVEGGMSDIVRRQLLVQGLGEPHNRELGSDVWGHHGKGEQSGDGRCVHDMPPAAL